MSGWLIDTSALASLARSPDAVEWAVRIERRLVRICTVTRLEVGYAAKTGADPRTAARHSPPASTPVKYQILAIEDRAVAVQMLLADRGHHRAPSVPDLTVAATAELAGLTAGVGGGVRGLHDHEGGGGGGRAPVRWGG